MKTEIKCRLITWGERLFRIRSYTPIPLFLFMFFCFWWEWENNFMVWFCGLFFVICGESIRLWSLRYMGRFSRTSRKRKAKTLITNGPYNLVRNPLYGGNLFILIGITILSELLWLIPIVVLLFFLQYYCIVLWEEEMLRSNFPKETKQYFNSVPRWLPTWDSVRRYIRQTSGPAYPWLNIFRRERSTLLGLYCMATVMILKEVLLE